MIGVSALVRHRCPQLSVLKSHLSLPLVALSSSASIFNDAFSSTVEPASASERFFPFGIGIAAVSEWKSV